MRKIYIKISSLLLRIYKRKTCKRHKWQKRAVNRWGNTTYRVCLRCGTAEEWDGGVNGHFVKCERIPEFDSQFDEKGRYV